VIVLTEADRPDIAKRGDPLSLEVWPEYNRNGDVTNVYWRFLHELFPEYQFVLYDEEADEVLAQGHSIPLSWDGTVDGLPAGIDGALPAAVELKRGGGKPNTLCAMAVEISQHAQGRGLSRLMLEAMRDVGAAHGLGDLIAPVRPSWKERYPLTPIERYVAWRREDGQAFDPWLRVHERLGGEILRPEPESLRITGTVAEWERWTDMRFPEPGSYVFPHGLAPLEVLADEGRYWEPNVWIRHEISAARSAS
jgi:GNAT superfamily N-acetyltransferase